MEMRPLFLYLLQTITFQIYKYTSYKNVWYLVTEVPDHKYTSYKNDLYLVTEVADHK